MSFSKKNYLQFGNFPVYFPKTQKIRIEKMREKLILISTVCPDYPNDGKKYTFLVSLV